MKDYLIKNKFGYCGYAFESDYVHIYNLYTYPGFRQQGKAVLILHTVIAAIRNTGYSGTIQIVAAPKESFVDRVRLSSFYARMGLHVFEYYG